MKRERKQRLTKRGFCLFVHLRPIPVEPVINRASYDIPVSKGGLLLPLWYSRVVLQTFLKHEQLPALLQKEARRG